MLAGVAGCFAGYWFVELRERERWCWMMTWLIS